MSRQNNNNSFDQRRHFLTSSPTSSIPTSSPSSNSSRRQRSIPTPLPSSSLSPHLSGHHSATRSPSSATHGSSALHSDSYFPSSPSGFTQIPTSPALSYRTQASEFRPYLPKNRGTSFSSNRSFGSDDGSNPLRSSGSSNGSASPTSQRSIEQAQRRAEHFRGQYRRSFCRGSQSHPSIPKLIKIHSSLLFHHLLKPVSKLQTFKTVLLVIPKMIQLSS